LATPTIQSGWAFEHAGQPHGSFGVIACCPAPRRGLTRFFQTTGVPFTTPEQWTQAERIRSSAVTGPLYGVAAIVTDDCGGLDMVVSQTDYTLAHFSYDRIGEWSGPSLLPGEACGPPAFIRSHFGGGHFEVVVPRPGGGLSHFWKEANANSVWREAANPPAKDGVWSGVGLIHSSFGNLELAGVKDGSLHFLWQNGEGGKWVPGIDPPDAGSVGRPALIQSTYGVHGNFEVVVAKNDGGLAHYWRNNDHKFAWVAGPAFGAAPNQSVYSFDDVSMFQSSYRRLEVFAVERYAKNKAAYRIIHYRSGLGQPWEGPIRALDIPYDVTWWPRV
jgi:hypothetical protein